MPGWPSQPLSPLSVPARVIGLALCAAVAFVTFICGAVLMFDHVDATEGDSATAWAVSIVGLVVSAVLGLGVAFFALTRFSVVLRSSSASLAERYAKGVSVIAVTVLAVLAITGLVD